MSLPPVAPADVHAIPAQELGHLPAVLQTITSGGAEMFMPDGMGCIPPVVSPTLGGSKFEYTSGGSCGCACNVPLIDRDIYLRCYRHLPAVLKRAYPACDVYLWWLLHRAWQDACHWENYQRCYHLRGGRTFVYTSGGSCGRAYNTRPRIGASTCGANINYTFFPKKCIFFKRRTQNVRFMYYLCSVNTK